MTIDLAAYFKRIGYSGAASPTLQTLQALHLHHAETIPFENLNPLLGWPVRLDIDSLQEKLIHNRRGGYCYEQNLLFKSVLQALGFHVVGLAARVSWNTSPDVVLPRTHMLMRVDLDGQPYIADVGFGGLTLTAPLRLEAETEQSTPHEPFRLKAHRDEFILQARLAEDWKSLYSFSLQEQLLPDYEMANWYVSCHPQSRFVTRLIAARPTRDRRYALLNNELAVHFPDGTTERRTLRTASELREALKEQIGLNLPSAPELDGVFQRLTTPLTILLPHSESHRGLRK
jgi:N-hydroxyarylamine O-acetyltransferase